MKARYTISQLARAAGVPPSTVRYYERIGLLYPNERTAGNYRLYAEDALEPLRFIRAAQAMGFALEDILYLLNCRTDDAVVCHEVQGLIEEHLSDLDKRMADLLHVQRVLKATLARCRETEWKGRCQVIDMLTASSASPP